jgi:uncharacterized protein YidB (DUF937 family)/heat shock protein HslJ
LLSSIGARGAVIFEKLVIEAAQRLNLPTATVSSILGSLIGTMTNERTGGINGFVDSFRRAGVGDFLTSWIGGKEGKPLTASHVERSLGSAAIEKIADDANVTTSVASSAVAFLLPRVVGLLTPTGTLPTNEAVLRTTSKYFNRPAPVPTRLAEPRSSSRWLPWATVAALALAAFLVMRDRPTIHRQKVASDSARVVQEAGGSVALTANRVANDLMATTWMWTSISTPNETRTVDTPERYTVRFDSAGRVTVRADCNRGTGTYTVSSEGRLMVNPLALTRAMCPPGSMSDRFAAHLGRATRYEVRNAELFLSLPGDSGTLRLRRAKN